MVHSGSSTIFDHYYRNRGVDIDVFVALTTTEAEQSISILFYITKVLDIWRQVAEDGIITKLWYQLWMPPRVQDITGKFHQCYGNCMNWVWKPSKESNDDDSIK